MHLEIAIQTGFNAAVTLAFVDPFRVANYLLGQRRYRWQLLSKDGGAITASNGMEFNTRTLDSPWSVHGNDHQDNRHDGNGTCEDPERADDIDAVVKVVSLSWNPEAFAGPQARRWFRPAKAPTAKALVGLDNGAFALASLGAFKPGTGACLHSEHHAAFREAFPNQELSNHSWNLAALAANIGTAVGPTGAANLALELLSQFENQAFAKSVADYLYMSLESHAPEPTANEAFGALNLMEHHIESPLTIMEICGRLDCPPKRLNRQFQRAYGIGAKQKYLQIRLEKARQLVAQTRLSIVEISVATGFSAVSSFSTSFRRQFNQTPSQMRKGGQVPFELRG